MVDNGVKNSELDLGNLLNLATLTSHTLKSNKVHSRGQNTKYKKWTNKIIRIILKRMMLRIIPTNENNDWVK